MWRWEFWVGALLCTASCALGSLESPELAWLLANESPPAPVAAKRITPKSVFVAPSFSSSCAEGYRQDPLGRCVRVIKIDEAAQWEFFLQKLNAMYAPPPVKPQHQNTGPFRLPIPLDTETTTMPTTMEPTTEATTTMTTSMPTTLPSTLPSTTTEEETSTYTTPQDETTILPLRIVVANTTETDETTTMPTTLPETTTVPQQYYTRINNEVRFPNSRPYIVRHPNTQINFYPNPQWIWYTRPSGYREPRKSWTH